jgi:membrane protein
MGLGFLLLVSLVLDAAMKGLSDSIDDSLPFGAPLLMGVSFVVSLALIAVLFAAIYKLLPAKPLAWPDVIFGAIVTAVLFEIGKFLIGLYLGSAGASSSLGAAGALLVAFLGLLFADFPFRCTALTPALTTIPRHMSASLAARALAESR